MSTLKNLLGIMVMLMALVPSAQAIDLDFNFDSYTTGPLAGQDGWTVTAGAPYIQGGSWLEGVNCMVVWEDAIAAATHSLAAQTFTDTGTTFSYLSQRYGGGSTSVSLIGTGVNNDYVQINTTPEGTIRVFHGQGWTDLDVSWVPGVYRTTVALNFPAQTFTVSVEDLTWPTHIIIPGTFTFMTPVTKYTAKGTLLVRAFEGTNQGAVFDSMKFSANISSAYLGNTLGISDTPPPPWPAMSGSTTQINCWNRQYTLGTLGLPSSMQSYGTEILSSTAELRFTQSGVTLPWTAVSRTVTSATDAKIVIDGVDTCSVGTMNYTITAEYDGMLRYDFTLTPLQGATLDTMELRIPQKKSGQVTLYWLDGTNNGTFPLATSGITMSSGAQQYAWFGNEQYGLTMICEDTSALDMLRPVDEGLPAHCRGWRIEQTSTEATNIWSFVLSTSPRALTGPWHMTFGIQATPTKPKPDNWRLLRATAPNQNINIHWPQPSEIEYFTPPYPKDPSSYTQMVAGSHSSGKKFLPYSCLLWTSLDDPEVVANPTWLTGTTDNTSPDVMAFGESGVGGIYPVASWMDYIVWYNHELVQDYDTDGIYVDFTSVQHYTNPALGFGYYRDNTTQPTRPFFTVRKLYQRVYTMLKQLDNTSLIIAHVSGNINTPHLSFCDIVLDGEQFGNGALYDNYLDVCSLDKFRAGFMGHQYGYIPWFLPQWYNATLADSDVVKRQTNGKPDIITVEKSQHLFGLALLHDFWLWSICGQNQNANNQFYGVMDTFGIGDAVFYPYWNNSSLISGQTSTLIASAYRKPPGDALIAVYNTTRTAQNSNLTVDFNSLKSPGALVVTDAYTGENIPVSGNNLSISVPPLNYRLIQVKGILQIQGTVILANYLGDRKKVVIWVELRQGATVVREEGTFLDTNGQFTLLDVPLGTYDVAIKSYAHLQKVVPGVIISTTGSTNIGTVTLINGDPDGDNEVTSTDLSIVLANMDIMGD